jgi:hypothetical protein
MQIHSAHLERLSKSPMRGEAVATIFEAMAAGMDVLGAPTASFSLDYQHPGDVLGENELIPVITLSLRPAPVEKA